MGYENAPATRMMATHCVCCGKSLVDAPSLESGMGPICRQKYGYNDDMAGISERRRKSANKLICEAAAVFRTDKGRVMEIALTLKRRRLPRISAILMDRVTTIKLVDVHTTWERRNAEPRELHAIQVYTPFSRTFLDEIKRRVHWNERCIIDRPSTNREKNWDRRNDRKVREFRFSHWEVSAVYKDELMAALIASFPGEVATGGKGAFVIPSNHTRRAAG